ncbi:MAG: hypothetical protein H7Y86_12895 [Rhizobacter sp.]|nr:hypothetical protein [Ferruginibacter sp.]
MKYFLISFILFFSISSYAQFSSNIYWTEQTTMPSPETIYYTSAQTLSWNDFKGRPDNNSPAAAMTASGFGYKADFKSVGNSSQLNIAVYCYFSKKNSWVKPGKNTAYILNHEQHHFNISFISADLFLGKLKSAGLTKANYNTLLPKLYNECVTLMNKMQNEYDGQTKNGQLKDVQDQWNEFVGAKVKAATK